MRCSHTDKILQFICYLLLCIAFACSLVLLRGVQLYGCSQYPDIYSSSPYYASVGVHNLLEELLQGQPAEELLPLLPDDWDDTNMGYQFFLDGELVKECMYPGLSDAKYVLFREEVLGKEKNGFIKFYVLNPLQYGSNDIDEFMLAEQTFNFYSRFQALVYPMLAVTGGGLLALLVIRYRRRCRAAVARARRYAYLALSADIMLLSIYIFYHPALASHYFWEPWIPLSKSVAIYFGVLVAGLLFVYALLPLVCRAQGGC